MHQKLSVLNPWSRIARGKLPLGILGPCDGPESVFGPDLQVKLVSSQSGGLKLWSGSGRRSRYPLSAAWAGAVSMPPVRPSTSTAAKSRLRLFLCLMRNSSFLFLFHSMLSL